MTNQDELDLLWRGTLGRFRKIGKERPYNPRNFHKIVSWNVNGMKSWISKGGAKVIESEAPTCLILQETKLSGDEEYEDLFEGYRGFFNNSSENGFSGTAVFVREGEPFLGVVFGAGGKDPEGRTITVEYRGMYLVNGTLSGGSCSQESLRAELGSETRALGLQGQRMGPIDAQIHLGSAEEEARGVGR